MERRLVAILAADVVGYSRLMAADEKGTHARLKALRQDFIEPKIAQHRGRIVKLMGDGALVEFASVVDALECAAKIQSGVVERQQELPEHQPIAFRIGINIGDVIIEGDDIYGDGVNVAARLEGPAEPGGVVVSGTAFDQARNKVNAGFEYLGEQQVKNLPEPVRTYRVLLDPEAAGTIIEESREKSSRARWATVAAVVLLMAAAGTAGWLWLWPAALDLGPPLPEKPSIAVLPFDNLSGDPEQAYFADGITEDLITDLSKVGGLFVIARNSTFAYKDQSPEVREVASDLGVRNVLEGSVRRTSDQVRINAQLIDATTGGHVWADRYDGTLGDVFGLQDQVVQRIVGALAVNLTAPERQRQQRAETLVPEAYDAFLKGWQHYVRRTPEHYGRALAHFETAVELDPDYARAHAAIASIHWQSYVGEWLYGTVQVDLNERRRKAEEHLELAMRDPTPLAHQVRSKIELYWRNQEGAIAAAKRAVALDPNDADARAALAEALIFAGRHEDALSLIDTARRLDPYNEGYHSFLLGLAHFGMGNFESAATSLERAIEINPDLWSLESGNYSRPSTPLAAAYAYLGREEEASARVDAIKEQWPNARVAMEMYFWPFQRDEDKERLAEGLRRAGMPEN